MDTWVERSNYYLGKIYLHKGDTIKACEAFQISVRLGEKEGERAYRQYCQ